MDVNKVVNLEKSAGHVVEGLQPGIEQTQDMNATEGTTALSLQQQLLVLEKRFANLEARYTALEAEKTGILSLPGFPIEQELDAKPKAELPIGRICVRVAKTRDGERDFSDAESNKALKPATVKQYPIELRKIYVPGADRNYGELEIRSPGLRKLLRSLLPHYPGHEFIGDTLVLESPYAPLVFNWNLLWEAAVLPEHEKQSEEDRQARSDLHELLQTIKQGSGDDRLDSYLKVRDDLVKQKSITFEALWTIFPPGATVYSHPFFRNDPLQDQIFIVLQNSYWPWINEESEFRSIKVKWPLTCFMYDHDGAQFTRTTVQLRIEPFEGPKPITSLSCFPFTAMEEDERKKIESRLMTRGLEFRRFCQATGNGRMFQYDGNAIFEQSGFRSLQLSNDSETRSEDDYMLRTIFRKRRSVQSQEKPQKILPLTKSNVMVDFRSYFRYGPNSAKVGDLPVYQNVDTCACQICSQNEALQHLFKPDYDRSGKVSNASWDDLQLMLCAPRVLGYVLKDKQWAQLAVTKLSDVEKEDAKAVLNTLHLVGRENGISKKNLLMALVRNHGKVMVKDIVAGKGEGLVFLLYGEPGVGKTSTAQIIARAARKPLFSIGVADVGTKAKEVESNLETIFSLATQWGAILLIDEADVFLQNRSGGGIQGPSAEGSALVSVFLKVLEYYGGILFLTTNQIAQFDVAVESRVHIAMHYPKLDREQTKHIFMSFVNQYYYENMIGSDAYDEIASYADSEKLTDREFDGRQLRNIVGCAMSHAKEQGRHGMMTLRNIEDVVGYVQKFQTDLAGKKTVWRERQGDAGLRT